MKTVTPEERIRELVGDLRPVRRVPPLRIAAAGSLLPPLIVVALGWVVTGASRPSLFADPLGMAPESLAILAGLTLLAFGSTIAALASALPDRIVTMRRAGLVASLGAGIALVGALRPAFQVAVETHSAWWWGCVACLSHATGIGLIGGLAACLFMTSAAMRRPSSSAAMALAGGVALGAAAVHVACAQSDALHQLLAHALAPAIAVLLLSIPLGLGLKHWVDRRTRD